MKLENGEDEPLFDNFFSNCMEEQFEDLAPYEAKQHCFEIPSPCTISDGNSSPFQKLFMPNQSHFNFF